MTEVERRIGKSYIAEELAQNEYDSYIFIDFSKAPTEIFDLFDHYLHNLYELFDRLQLFYGVNLILRRSVVIFDEVQFCPRARSSIKHLVADGRDDYIETESLISIKRNVKDILIPSEEICLEMNPMDFEEFLWACGNDRLMPFIRQQSEVKTGEKYSFTSLRKYKAKYGQYLSTSYLIHDKNLKIEDDIIFIPIYMTLLL